MPDALSRTDQFGGGAGQVNWLGIILRHLMSNPQMREHLLMAMHRLIQSQQFGDTGLGGTVGLKGQPSPFEPPIPQQPGLGGHNPFLAALAQMQSNPTLLNPALRRGQGI